MKIENPGELFPRAGRYIEDSPDDTTACHSPFHRIPETEEVMRLVSRLSNLDSKDSGTKLQNAPISDKTKKLRLCE